MLLEEGVLPVKFFSWYVVCSFYKYLSLSIIIMCLRRYSAVLIDASLTILMTTKVIIRRNERTLPLNRKATSTDSNRFGGILRTLTYIN